MVLLLFLKNEFLSLFELLFMVIHIYVCLQICPNCIRHIDSFHYISAYIDGLNVGFISYISGNVFIFGFYRRPYPTNILCILAYTDDLIVGFTEFPSHKLISWFNVKCYLTILLFTPFFYCIEQIFNLLSEVSYTDSTVTGLHTLI